LRPLEQDGVLPQNRRSLLNAILTDAQFWLPVIVLIIGIGLLVVVR
jgi:hypothetical protein